MTGELEEIPEPLVPYDVDLRDFRFTPMFRARLFGSEFHAQANDAEWRAGVTLWLKSWDQVPAGTLPENDVALARLAEFGKDIRAWREVKTRALHGWRLCTDGRLHHAVVAEGVLDAWEKRKKNKAKGIAGASKRWGSSNASANASAIGQAMPGDSKGQGQGERQGIRTPAAKAAAPGGAQNALPKSPSPDDKTWLFNEGIDTLQSLTRMPPKRIRALMGKWLKELADNAAVLRSIIGNGKSINPIDPIPWLTAAVAARKSEAMQPKKPEADDDGWRWSVRNWRRRKSWNYDDGPNPDQDGTAVPAHILAEFPFGWTEPGTGPKGPERAEN